MKLICILVLGFVIGNFTRFETSYGDTTKVAEFYDNGQVKFKGTKVHKLKHGKWFYYNENGFPIRIERYKYGKKIKSFTLGSLDVRTDEK